MDRYRNTIITTLLIIKMETSSIKQIEISRDQLLHYENIQKNGNILPNLTSQIQFLLSRTDELRTVLKEIDETLKRIKEETLKSFT